MSEAQKHRKEHYRRSAGDALGVVAVAAAIPPSHSDERCIREMVQRVRAFRSGVEGRMVSR
jgi:hypothetical protein